MQAISQVNNKTAYFMGFTMADGCYQIRKDGRDLLQYNLAAKDFKQLLSIKSYFGGYGNLYYRESNHSWHYHIYCQSFKKHLIKWGIVPRKTYNFIEPKIDFTPELMRHFLIGWIDGDGHISYSRQIKTWRFNITGMPTQMEWLQEAFKIAGFNESFYYYKYKNKNTACLAICGNLKVRRLVKALKAINCPYKLNRKWAKVILDVRG